MKMLFGYLRPMRAYIALALTIKTSSTLVELVIPYILSYILDDVVPTHSVKRILLFGGVMIACAALGCIGNISANRMAAKVARNSAENIRHDLFFSILHLSSAQIDRYTVPSLESRLTSDTYNVHNFIGMSMRMGVRAPLLLIGGIIVSLTLDPVLTLVMLAVLPFISLSVYLITKCGIPLFKQNQKSVDSMIRIVREDSQGIRVIKALSKTDFENRKYDTANRKLISDETKASVTMAASNPAVTFLLNIGLVAVVLVGATRVNSNLSQPGKIIAFIQYFTLISNAMIGITKIFVRYSKGAASAQRIAEVINTPPDLIPHEADGYPTRKDESGIVFDDVSFSYTGVKDNLSHISFSLGKGQSLGIIGATGSGKTTIASLLMRFYDIKDGSVRIDGKDIRTYSPNVLHTMFGTVMQNDFIYNGTVADNIDFGRNLSREEISRAAELAQAKEFIDCYPDGFDHILNSKGTNVSGGQKQRLLIARALAGNPQILVLDDSSSALDYKTDANLRRSIRENMANTTAVVIAQRVSSVMNCDLIIVLDEGKIIGLGSHNDLVESCETYREISASQIGGAFLE